jgi:hypothetical protein
MAINTEIAGATIVPKAPSFEGLDYSTLAMGEPARFNRYQLFRYWPQSGTLPMSAHMSAFTVQADNPIDGYTR